MESEKSLSLFRETSKTRLNEFNELGENIYADIHVQVLIKSYYNIHYLKIIDINGPIICFKYKHTIIIKKWFIILSKIIDLSN